MEESRTPGLSRRTPQGPSGTRARVGRRRQWRWRPERALASMAEELAIFFDRLRRTLARTVFGGRRGLIWLAVATFLVSFSLSFYAGWRMSQPTASPDKVAATTTAEVAATEGTPGETALPSEVDLSAMRQPVAGKVSRGFGFTYSNTHEDFRYHAGIDIQAPAGTPVVAALAGKVVVAQRDSAYGLLVMIEHGGGVETLYANLSQMAVKEGDTVEAGQVIGSVGSSAATESADPAHLHFQVVKDGKDIDPGLR